jgi:hypothetical protein
MAHTQSNPWKIAVIALVASIVAALASGMVVANARDARDPAASESQAEGTASPAPAQPTRGFVEDCERYRYMAHTDGGRVVKNGLIGGALGAGLGAAGGAIGGSAGKGAGIGALAGAVVSSGYTLHDEHRKKEAARHAYGACLARNGR